MISKYFWQILLNEDREERQRERANQRDLQTENLQQERELHLAKLNQAKEIQMEKMKLEREIL